MADPRHQAVEIEVRALGALDAVLAASTINGAARHTKVVRKN
jgi:hypothetical protein